MNDFAYAFDSPSVVSFLPAFNIVVDSRLLYIISYSFCIRDKSLSMDTDSLKELAFSLKESQFAFDKTLSVSKRSTEVPE